MTNTLRIALAGVPGNLCREIVALLPEHPEAVLCADALVSESRAGVADFLGHKIRGWSALNRDFAAESGAFANAVVLDFTTPSAALGNVQFYTRHQLPFVLGTTGFDRGEAARLVQESGTHAVIAPNMAAPIVALMAVLSDARRRFPGLLEGWQATIRESHQMSKRDTSGTAVAIAAMLRDLGVIAPESAITPIRDPAEQRRIAVPEAVLSGHGWHWYELRSPDGSVALDFSHRINGRRIYAQGALLAARFLQRKIAASATPAVWSMEDVLSSPS